jgi:uncharacterized protein YndB with AHSA1/START domain
MRPVTIEDRLHMRAAAPDVWRAIEDPTAHAAWHPYLTAIAGEHRVGETRTCSVLIGGKPGKTRERCIEAEPERSITWAVEHDTTGFSRMVSDWRAGFTIAPGGDGTAVTARSAFRPRNLAVRAMLPLIRRRFHRTQQDILEALARSVEATQPTSPVS